MSDKLLFVTTVLCWGFLGKKDGTQVRCYETEAQRFARLKELAPKVGAKFIAKVALVIRIRDGGRSIAHFLTALVLNLAGGEPWLEEFLVQVMVRPDDMIETTAAFWINFGQQRNSSQEEPAGRRPMKLPNALKRAIAARFNMFDAYRLAKYSNVQGTPSLRNLLLMVHPKPKDANQSAIFKALLEGTLKNEDTWEARLSAANTPEAKTAEWTRMVASKKMLPLALVKNLRNIAENCSRDVVYQACSQLCDATLIKNTGIMPTDFIKAYEVVKTIRHSEIILPALNQAFALACGNLPSVGHNVLIAIDHSGSMKHERQIAALMAAVLLKANPNADVMLFATDAAYRTFNRNQPVLDLAEEIRAALGSGSTNFHAVFNRANKAYDTIIILSDNEGWMNAGRAGWQVDYSWAGAPTQARQAYAERYRINPKIFSFDLGGDGSLMFRQDSIVTIAGSGFLVFKLLNYLKNEPTTIVDLFDSVNIGRPIPTFAEVDED